MSVKWIIQKWKNKLMMICQLQALMRLKKLGVAQVTTNWQAHKWTKVDQSIPKFYKNIPNSWENRKIKLPWLQDKSTMKYCPNLSKMEIMNMKYLRLRAQGVSCQVEAPMRNSQLKKHCSKISLWKALLNLIVMLPRANGTLAWNQKFIVSFKNAF